jgi:hypothetical protein
MRIYLNPNLDSEGIREFGLKVDNEQINLMG